MKLDITEAQTKILTYFNRGHIKTKAGRVYWIG